MRYPSDRLRASPLWPVLSETGLMSRVGYASRIVAFLKRAHPDLIQSNKSGANEQVEDEEMKELRYDTINYY